MQQGYKWYRKVKLLWSLDIGETNMGKKAGNNFHDIKYSRIDRIISLQIVKSHVTVQNVIVPVDSLPLFQRILCKEMNDDLTERMKVEIAPYQVSFSIKLEWEKQKSHPYLTVSFPYMFILIIEAQTALFMKGIFFIACYGKRFFGGNLWQVCEVCQNESTVKTLSSYFIVILILIRVSRPWSNFAVCSK